MIIESALCARVREITAQHDAACRHIRELEAKTQTATIAIESRDQELAGLRHAILEAARIGTNISRERFQADGQAVEGWKRLISTLLASPLSRRQRGLITEIACALDGWRKGRTDVAPGVEFHVESFELHQSEFNCTEMIEGALADIRKSAEEAGATVRTSVVGPVPQCAGGSVRHIHQLITLLAASLRDFGCAESLEVKVSFQAKENGDAEMLLSFLLPSTNHSDENLGVRLCSLTDGSAPLRALRRGGAELALSSAWELTLALGGSPAIKTTADQMVDVQIALPLLAAT